MNGKIFYFALAALFGILSSLAKLFLLFMLVHFYFLYKIKHYSRSQLALVIVIFSIFLISGSQAVSRNKSIIPENTSSFILEYNQDSKIDGDLLQVVAVEQAYREKLVVHYKIKSEQEKEELRSKDFYGCICKVSGDLKRPAAAKNPNGFDYREYLKMKKIHWLLESKENPFVNCTAKKVSPIDMIKKFRFNGKKFLENHNPPEIASLSAALIFGDRSLLSPDLLGDYQRTGIVHLLAISGLHVSLLVGMVFFVGIRIGFTRKFMMNFLLFVLPIYVILTGSSPSVNRAVMMICLVLITVKWKDKIKLSPLDALSIALMIYLFFFPLTIYDVGFQLSFTVSFAIILSAPYIMKRYKNTLIRMLATSIISQLAAFPLLLYHFFEISLISIAANLVYIPLFSFIFLPGLYLLFIIELIFCTAPYFMIQVFAKLIQLSNLFITKLAQISIAHFIPGRPNSFFLFLYIFTIIIIFYLWETQNLSKRKQYIFVLTFFLFTFQVSWNFLDPWGEVTMIDVGQGDSVMIHLPNGKGNYLIDTGGSMSFSEGKWRERAKPYEVGRDVVVPFLKGKGITTIDKLILTHGDMDHIGGSISIIKELKVKQILLPSVVQTSEMELLILREAKKKGIPVTMVSQGDRWISGGAFFQVLSPEKNFSGERNRGSIAIFAKIGGLTWFFGGDLDQEGEIKIIQNYPHLRVDVLKAGHHGSKTSSADAFINQLKPNVTLISVGEKNRFGHPHQEVIDKLTKVKSLIFRTDQQGAVTYRFYHEKGTFSSVLP